MSGETLIEIRNPQNIDRQSVPDIVALVIIRMRMFKISMFKIIEVIL